MATIIVTVLFLLASVQQTTVLLKLINMLDRHK